MNEISSQFEGKLFRIPWGHHKYIVDKCGNDSEKAITNFSSQLMAVGCMVFCIGQSDCIPNFLGDIYQSVSVYSLCK